MNEMDAVVAVLALVSAGFAVAIASLVVLLRREFLDWRTQRQRRRADAERAAVINRARQQLAADLKEQRQRLHKRDLRVIGGRAMWMD